MISIDKFRSAAQAAEQQNRSATFNLTSDKSNLRSTGRGLVRWARNFNTANNREVANRFVDALENSYGREIVEVTGLHNSLRDGKPLHARRISQALELAAKTKTQFATANKSIVAGYLKTTSGTNTSLLRVKYAAVAQALLGDADADHLLSHADIEEVGRMVEAAVDEFGREGKTFVTSEQLDKKVQEKIARHIADTYLSSLVERTWMANPGSPSQQTIDALNASALPGMRIDPDRIHESMVSSMKGEVEDKLSHLIFSKMRALERDGVVDTSRTISREKRIGVADDVRQQLVDEATQKFAKQRFAAGQAVQQLSLDPQVKASLLQQTLHDSVPAAAIPAFGAACDHLSEQLLRLSEGRVGDYLELTEELATLHPGKEPGTGVWQADPQDALVGLHDTIMDVLRQAAPDGKGELAVTNRDSTTQDMFRTLLATYKGLQVSALAEQLNSDTSEIGSLRQGVRFAAHEFAGSASYLDHPPHDRARYDTALGLSQEYDMLFSNLAQVLRDHGQDVPAVRDVEKVEDLADNTIRMLRNMDISLPVPNRLGSVGEVALSQPAMDKVQKELDSMVDIGSKRVEDGVLEEFKSAMGRATFFVNGVNSGTQAEAVVDALRKFCTDDSGRLDENMLLGISKFASQASGNPVSSLFVSESAHAPFQGSVSGGNADDVSYDISRNTHGGVDIRASVRNNSVAAMHGKTDADGTPRSIELNAALSHYGSDMQISLDAETAAPTLKAASVDYALFAEQQRVEDLSDDTIRTLRNTGVSVPAPDRLGSQASKVTLSTAAMADMQSQLDSMVDIGRQSVADGVLNDFTRDIGRATFLVNGVDAGAEKMAVVGRLREFCTDDSGQVDEQMLLGISKFAYQAIHATLWNQSIPDKEHLALFQGSISMGSPDEISYDISRNEQGGVDIRAYARNDRLSAMIKPDANQEAQAIALNDQLSHYSADIQISLDAATAAPTLNAVLVDYALFEAT